MEAFATVSFSRRSFFNNVMFDINECRILPRSCIDYTGMLHYQYSNPRKPCKLVLSGCFGVGSCLSGCNGHNSWHTTLMPFRHPSQSRSLRSCRVKADNSDGNLSGERVILTEQTLEQELQIAIKEENYAQAAKIRDSLKTLQEDSKASVLGANARFYNSFRNGDLAAMQALWSKGEHVCVVHPGVSGISGNDLVMGSWEFVWADYDFPLDIEIKDIQVHVRGDVGYVTCIEMVKKKQNNWTRHFATNVFERINGQWFMCIHHSSYVDL
ncbi:F-box SKIP8-like isoform X2 [Olea europaea subsp. europaea]|uniref:F-box SKIP8-like isoform X2 n=2 Tax=Olea europaea subsp. europaea TaxID=158383 RepID=A0A8S0S5H6_OLEEU|nr:F-box SKIP8-like isoform X2 [Olea europaea subsp. europaea]